MTYFVIVDIVVHHVLYALMITNAAKMAFAKNFGDTKYVTQLKNWVNRAVR
jgi:hypothetical protein